MATTPEIPLHLFQVLEEEYLSLHGKLSAHELVRLRDREKNIVAEPNWLFHDGHVIDETRLAFKLNAQRASGWGNLIAHLDKVSPRFKEKRAAARSAQDFEAALNELLIVKIYDSDAFKYINIQDALRILLANQSKATPGSPELAHVNRLLLEQTFPEELEKISDIRLAAMFQRLHTHSSTVNGVEEHGQAAICLSGGGIRSGTFALGILQGLARYNLLAKFDYLSTVSGGGYIGGWLTAWLHRHQRELAGVTEDLSAVEPKSKIDPDPQAIQYLREYSNFLTPKAGLLTADTWSFVAIYFRNLILNWVVLFPLILALLALPRLNVALLMAQVGTTELIGLSFPARYVFLAVGSLLLILALTYIIISRPAVSAKVTEHSRFWRGRLGQKHFLSWCLLPLVSAVFCLTTYWAWSTEAHGGFVPGKLLRFVIFGIIVTLTAWLISAISLGRFTHLSEWGLLELAEMAILIAVGAGGGALLYSASKPIAMLLSYPGQVEWYASYAVPLMLFVILMATTLFIGLTSQGVFRWSELLNDEDREWWARFGAWVLIAMIAWAIFNILSIHGPSFFFMAPGWISSIGGISGLASLLAGFSAGTPANEEQSASKGGLLKSFFRDHMLPFMALLFLLAFLVTMSLLVTILLYVVATLVNELQPAALLRPMRPGFSYVAPLTAKTHMDVVHYARLGLVSAFVLVGVIVSVVLGNRINLNKFSLHGGYRNRLIRGFLGASRTQAMRRPNPFTGFDPEDNIQMHELRPVLFQEGDFPDLEALALRIKEAQDELSQRLKSWLKEETRIELESYTGGEPLAPRLRINLIEDLNTVLESGRIIPNDGNPAGLRALKEGEAAPPQDYRTVLHKRSIIQKTYPTQIREKYPPPHRLLHVVNTSLNLVGGKRLAWQQRKAEPFAITPLHAGCFRVGYRRSLYYGGYRGISLGTAVAISGAAASSNMGYYTTSPVLSMVLTLFNVRLGWWLGNPGPAGDRTYRLESPRVSLRPVIDEAFGMTDDTNPYVYLTDGGHFENLALFEMVLRRCRLIVLSDAAADGDFEFNDLGNAVRKIRIDLGVTIDFEEVKIFKEKPEGDEAYTYWAFGKIRYSEVDKITSEDGSCRPAPDGLLIYVKPAIYGDAEPRDVLQYKKSNADFPHQSTGDQFFDEPQFESYRTLGSYIMNRICANEFDTTNGAARPLRDLNRAQFVRASLENYPGKKPEWLAELINAGEGKWLA